ncbi:hypothetical protein GGX14DRAFT_557477 [Mycena pura]|uniref:Uncharacterized protein n=1 Tax=Mycena pura TaxID=153505 RepID=A0AAD7E380_9AGAR|nr:hypothetical protein GGX14DRAFT_557477 [Mycena pura]
MPCSVCFYPDQAEQAFLKSSTTAGLKVSKVSQSCRQHVQHATTALNTANVPDPAAPTSSWSRCCCLRPCRPCLSLLFPVHAAPYLSHMSALRRPHARFLQPACTVLRPLPAACIRRLHPPASAACCLRLDPLASLVRVCSLPSSVTRIHHVHQSPATRCTNTSRRTTGLAPGTQAAALLAVHLRRASRCTPLSARWTPPALCARPVSLSMSATPHHLPLHEIPIGGTVPDTVM